MLIPDDVRGPWRHPQTPGLAGSARAQCVLSQANAAVLMVSLSKPHAHGSFRQDTTRSTVPWAVASGDWLARFARPPEPGKPGRPPAAPSCERFRPARGPPPASGADTDPGAGGSCTLCERHWTVAQAATHACVPLHMLAGMMMSPDRDVMLHAHLAAVRHGIAVLSMHGLL